MTQARLKELFDYHSDGFFITKLRNYNTMPGKILRGCKRRGKRIVCIPGEKREYAYHRLIFTWHHGFTSSNIDHVNRNPQDNRIENLRPCNQSQNVANSLKRRKNKSGFKGVSWSAHANMWRTSITVRGKSINLGYFDNLINAARAYDKAASDAFGSFACTNFNQMHGYTGRPNLCGNQSS